jgi:hypothetical protein
MNEQEIQSMIEKSQLPQITVEGNTKREYADATMSVSWAIGALMQGWITYAQSKIHFQLESIADKKGFFAGAGFIVHNSTLKPELVASKTGRFSVKDTIIGPGEHLMEFDMFVNGESVFDSTWRFVVWGVGPGELLEGKVSFSEEKH